VNFLRQKPGNSADHVSADEFYEHIPPRRSKNQEGRANLYRQIDDRMGWNVADCITR
jgi:hypothetical protein